MSESFNRTFNFSPERRFCIGAEEEVWTVHRDTGRLIPIAPRIFVPGYEARYPNLKPELPAQQIEAVTPVCRNMLELAQALRANQEMMDRCAVRHGFKLSRAPVPVKPFAIRVFPKPRYLEIKRVHGAKLANAFIAGLHVHVGVGSGTEAVDALNVVRQYLPTLLQHSACASQRRSQTGYASLRFMKYRAMAGTTVPPYLQSWEHFRGVAERHQFADDPRNCWWSVRISPHGTVETRIFDVQPSLEKTMYLAGATRMLVRAAVLGHLRAAKLEPSQIETDLLKAAKGRWDTSDMSKALKPLHADSRYADEYPFAAKLFSSR